MNNIAKTIAAELSVQPQQVAAAIELLDNGDTVPFISRYRKEVTGGLDDSQMRNLDDRLRYLRELGERKSSICSAIEEQGKLTAELKHQIDTAVTKSELEDLYLPYKKKRKTKGQIAIAQGLEPLADKLLNNPLLTPEDEAAQFINDDISDAKMALEGAKYILMERFAETSALVSRIKRTLADQAHIIASVIKGKETEGEKFKDYFEHNELLSKAPSHRILAMLRGRNEGILSLALTLKEMIDAPLGTSHPCEGMIAKEFGIENQGRPADRWLSEVVKWCWRIKLYPHAETDLMGQLRERADNEAIAVFGSNLKDLLLAAPAGSKATIGLDPGLRTGVKVAVVDATGKVVDHGAIFPTPPQNRIQEAAAKLKQWIEQHNIQLIAIGNGTASRETERFVKDLLKAQPQLKATPVVVNESGASIYSASEFAAKELPNLDVTIRGAVSIARRLQDPLAELVKIEPKSIGVGQYQHDVNQAELNRQLNNVVEDCVNNVGVELNTASAALLGQVAGLNSTIANNIIDYREQNGEFSSRRQLLKVARLGPKAYEQAAGFLRIHGAKNPLDASAVHPESYEIVENIAAANDCDVAQLIGNGTILSKVKAADFATEKAGLATVRDILDELLKPGRDPRPEFKTAKLVDGVEKVSDLREGMKLEGTVTNVTNFGAFVDIGVHQDGLVHISMLADRYVADPREIVKAGQVVSVTVMEVDVQRKRIALSMKQGATPSKEQSSKAPQRTDHQKQNKVRQKQSPAPANSAFAAAFANAKKR